MKLYLASTSPARLALLRQVGIEPVVVPSQVDEEAAVKEAEALRRGAAGISGTLDAPGTPDVAGASEPSRDDGSLSPAELVLLLARLKAEAVVDARPNGEPIDGFIVGGDSAFEFDGVIYGKPHLPAVARERWQRHRGRSGVLHSGHWMIDRRHTPGAAATAPAAGAVTSAVVEFADDITDEEIDAYIASGEPLEVAGAFTIDGLAAPFIRSVTGAPSTVIGMSLPTLRDLTRQLGVPWTEFWAE